MTTEVKGFPNGSQLEKIKNDLVKVCRIHKAVLIMVYDEKTHLVTFKIGENLKK